MKLSEIRDMLWRLVDDKTSVEIARTCRDKLHDDRSCSTCQARQLAIEEYRQWVTAGVRWIEEPAEPEGTDDVDLTGRATVTMSWESANAMTAEDLAEYERTIAPARLFIAPKRAT